MPATDPEVLLGAALPKDHSIADCSGGDSDVLEG